MSQGTRKLKMWGSAPSQSLGALFGCRLSALSAGRRRRQQIRPDDLYPIPAAIGTIPLTAAAAPIAPRSESFQVTPRQPELTFARVVNAQKKNKLRLRGTEMLANRFSVHRRDLGRRMRMRQFPGRCLGSYP